MQHINMQTSCAYSTQILNTFIWAITPLSSKISLTV